MAEDTMRRIVAGQAVMDLPSTVKELVDNALDAGSKTVNSTFKTPTMIKASNLSRDTSIHSNTLSLLFPESFFSCLHLRSPAVQPGVGYHRSQRRWMRSPSSFSSISGNYACHQQDTVL